VGNILELLKAQSDLASAQQQRIQALTNWQTARLRLAASLGQLRMDGI
jgi:outer membrane protein